MAEERVRIRLPAGGNAAQALVVLVGEDDGRNGTDVIVAKDYCVTDDALKVSDSASFLVANPDGVHSGKFFRGQRVEIDASHPDVADGQWCRQFTGRVTTVKSGSDLTGGTSILVSCMDLGWHLTKCDAPPLINTEQGTLTTLCSGYTDGKGRKHPGVIDPSWGFAATDPLNSNSQNTKLKQGRQGIVRNIGNERNLKAILPYIQVEPGQKPWDVIGPYTRRLGLLLNVGARGELIFFQPNFDQESAHAIHFHKVSEPELNKKNNVEGNPSLTEDIEGLYSEVQCWSTVISPLLAGPDATVQSIDPNAQYREDAYKPDQNPLPFNRLSVFSDTEAINQTMRKARAAYHAQMDAFQSWTYECDVRGHVARGQKRSLFFTSDMMLSVDDTVNQVGPSVFYLQAVRKSISKGGGAMTRLTIRLPILNPNLDAQLGGGAKRSAKPKAPVK